jgi:hypothetical protein
LFNRHFYATNDDRLNALHRVIRWRCGRDRIKKYKGMRLTLF